jgi:hypothetical protein
MRSILALIFLIGSTVVSVSAQTEGDLKKYFEGKQVTFRIAMPATKDGVNVYPERAQSLDYNEYSERLKDHGESIQRGEVATITKLRISDRSIEVQFGDSQTRFNIHFARVESWMLTPATLVDALNRYVEFSSSDKSSARLAEASVSAAGYVRRGVVHLGPRTTYLKEGLKTEEVVRLLGAPSSISDRKEAARIVSTYEFQRGEGRVLIAEFVGGVLVSSRIETRVTGSLAELHSVLRQ